MLGRRRTWQVAWFTTWQAMASTALTLVVGIAPAYVLARFRFVGRRLLLGLLTAAFVLPTVVMGAAFSALLPDSLDRSIWAILGAHVVFNLAVVVRTVGAVWEHLPPDLEAAAATLGASPRRVFREITLPLLRPALTAAGAIVFLFTFTSFGVIRILGTAGRPTLEVEIWRRATQLGEIGRRRRARTGPTRRPRRRGGLVDVQPAPAQPRPRRASAGSRAARSSTPRPCPRRIHLDRDRGDRHDPTGRPRRAIHALRRRLLAAGVADARGHRGTTRRQRRVSIRWARSDVPSRPRRGPPRSQS